VIVLFYINDFVTPNSNMPMLTFERTHVN